MSFDDERFDRMSNKMFNRAERALDHPIRTALLLYGALALVAVVLLVTGVAVALALLNGFGVI
jgi:hypothetical protein